MKQLPSYSYVIIFLLFASCAKTGPSSPMSADISGKGTISFDLAKQTIPSGIRTIGISLQRSGFSPISDSVSIANYIDTMRVIIENVPIGDWNVSVSAKDSSGVTRYTGTAVVSISENQVANVNVQMVKTESGTGGVQITIVWPTSHWQTLGSNPVLKQTSGTWDENNLYATVPVILKTNSLYQMWYTAGTNYAYGDTQSVAYATSTDGLNWTKLGTVLARGTVGSWNDRASDNCTVLYAGGLYKMWFEGCSMSHSHNGIGFAVSNDGMHWTIQPNPVIGVSSDRPQVFAPSVIKSGGVYFLYYTVESQSGSQENIYLATSTDGTNWQDQNKVLDRNTLVSWDQIGPFHARVIVDEGIFKMYYTVSSGGVSSIASASSIDGHHWTYNSMLPDLTYSDTSPWNTQMVGYPYVMRDDGTLKMWFAGYSAYSSKWQIGYAVLEK